MENQEKLFSEFPAVSTEEWESIILNDLRGADYEKKLVWETIEGIRVRPYYRKEDLEDIEYLNVSPGKFPYVRGTKKTLNQWEIRQDIVVENIKRANEEALFLLQRGVSSVGFSFIKKQIFGAEDISKLINGIDLTQNKINLNTGRYSPEIFTFLVKVISETGSDMEKVFGSMDYDPLGNLTATGNFYLSEEEDIQELATFIKKSVRELPGFRILSIHGLNFSNAGSSITQELAFSLAMGVEYLHRLTQAGLSIEDITPRIQFVLGTGSNYFMEIAKLRAVRYLWAKIVNEYKPSSVESAEMYIHSVTAKCNKTLYDPYVNMLRVTTESMSAIIGGTDSLLVSPYDSVFRKPSDFSKRIARNTQMVIKEEAYFDKTVDPSAGSYYIENLTDSLISESWKLFLEIEEEGGYVSAIKNGVIQKKIKETAENRRKNLAFRKEVLVGTNQYANPLDTALDKINTSIAFPDKETQENTICDSIKDFRMAEDFEKLRLNIETSDSKPKVFLFTIGNLTWRKARAAFSNNFFATAGYQIIDNNGFNTADEGVHAAESSGADIIVICSSDEEYIDLVPLIYQKLKHKILVVAGSPKNIEDLQAAGIKYFIHLKSNMLDTLKEFNELLGIKSF
ncbi:MAG: acyl-CoA mutase large subunit family protein [Bacteroidales bacterium]|nr:acyl-CoA mutase large subunit family protein [Bacteroidales bacterium]